MEKAIVKTLVYADLFDFPMKAWEIHKWLINKKVGLRDVEEGLNRLSTKEKVKSKKGYYFLSGAKKRGSKETHFLGQRRRLVGQRLKKEDVSRWYLKQASFIAALFRIIPWVKLVGVSGSVSMENAKKVDDIDFFIITQKNRLWISRILLLLILELSDKRRKRGEDLKKVSGKVCINLIVDEDSLGISKKDIYSAHEILQMRVLWQRDGIYQKYLEENEWVFKYLPNWTSARGPAASVSQVRPRGTNKPSAVDARDLAPSASPLALLENFAKWIQLRYMGKPEGKERVENGALFFHPQDYREKVLKDFKERLADFS